MSDIEKVQLHIRDSRPKIDKRAIDAFALKRFGEKYEREEIRKEVNKALRDLLSHKETVHPLDVYWVIIFSLLPQNIQAELV